MCKYTEFRKENNNSFTTKIMPVQIMTVRKLCKNLRTTVLIP